MRRSGDLNLKTSTRPAGHSSAVPGPRGSLGPRRRADATAAPTPLAGQPGHGCTACLRRLPVRMVNGQVEGGYTEAFELICCDCGDDPYLDYSQISFRLQQIRGPYTMRAGIAAYKQHLGLNA